MTIPFSVFKKMVASCQEELTSVPKTWKYGEFDKAWLTSLPSKVAAAPLRKRSMACERVSNPGIMWYGAAVIPMTSSTSPNLGEQW